MAFVASLLMLGMLYLYFENSLQARNHPNRDLQIAPGAELILKRSGDGHYVFPGTINGQSVSLLLDTGATLVSVPAHLAGTGASGGQIGTQGRRVPAVDHCQWNGCHPHHPN